MSTTGSRKMLRLVAGLPTMTAVLVLLAGVAVAAALVLVTLFVIAAALAAVAVPVAATVGTLLLVPVARAVRRSARHAALPTDRLVRRRAAS